MGRTLPFSMRLDAAMKAELQRFADEENRSLTNFVETELRRIVAERKAHEAEKAKRKQAS